MLSDFFCIPHINYSSAHITWSLVFEWIFLFPFLHALLTDRGFLFLFLFLFSVPKIQPKNDKSRRIQRGKKGPPLPPPGMDSVVGILADHHTHALKDPRSCIKWSRDADHLGIGSHIKHLRSHFDRVMSSSDPGNGPEVLLQNHGKRRSSVAQCAMQEFVIVQPDFPVPGYGRSLVLDQ